MSRKAHRFVGWNIYMVAMLADVISCHLFNPDGAEEAHQSAQEARRTADSYSKEDKSEEARRARIEATRAEDNAQSYSGRAREQVQDVQRMRELLEQYTR